MEFKALSKKRPEDMVNKTNLNTGNLRGDG